ncbi:hypothetical protein [Wansuia hejianensis]|uniref:Uncharacterized protein n=1 Tax=Wansuia hejianensis TaxID=2763667 RepID=A0A926EYT1_9FIRM|nr:hypothetical protein [Wansuia hejianensis]MBC8590091.1 hypothetical protein [Wansuia hejianensis]
MNSIYKIEKKLDLTQEDQKKILYDYENINYDKKGLEEYILENYNLDVKGKYGELEIKNPFGKASGQLSSNINQVKTDANDGLGFVVLKTVISQDKDNKSSMEEWKVNAPKMVVEEIESKSGEIGYTVTWKGRGWDKSFEDYLDLVKESYNVYKQSKVPVIPSIQYHLPNIGEDFKESEYKYTTQSIEKIWKDESLDMPFVIEQDFSATLASMENSQDEIIRWIQEVPRLIHKYTSAKDFILGMKLFNPSLGDEFQVKMLEVLNQMKDKVQVITAFNRLFDREREFEGKKGIAYGGYDLSNRNLRVLDKFIENNHSFIPISATGNINSGRMMVEYALRGATSGQMHTYFQLPSHNYKLKEGSRARKAIHELMFNPTDGLVPVMIHLKKKLNMDNDQILKFLDIYTLCNSGKN